MRARTAAAVYAVALSLASVTGCASDPVPMAAEATIDRSDPDQVIANAMQTMFTWDPGRDASPTSAYQRAAIYLSDDLATTTGDTTAPRVGSQWEQWRRDGTTITAQAYFLADETPSSSDDQTHRVVVVVQSALTTDHRLIDEIRHTAWVTATRSGDGWRVTRMEF